MQVEARARGRAGLAMMRTFASDCEDCDWVPRPRVDAAAPARHRDGGESAHAFSAAARRPDASSPDFPRDESETPICICGEVTKTSLRRFGGWKKIFEATLAGSERERAQPAAHVALVQSALRAEDDRDRSATGCFRQAATARPAALHGASGIRSDRRRRRSSRFTSVASRRSIRRRKDFRSASFARSFFTRLENLTDDDVETLLPRKHAAGERRHGAAANSFSGKLGSARNARASIWFSRNFSRCRWRSPRARAGDFARPAQAHAGKRRIARAISARRCRSA